MQTTPALAILLAISLAAFSLFGKFAFDMNRAGSYRTSWGWAFFAFLPGLLSALYLTSQPGVSAEMRNIILGTLGAVTGSCAVIWFGYVLFGARNPAASSDLPSNTPLSDGKLFTKIGIQIDQANRGILTVPGLVTTKFLQFIVSSIAEEAIVRCEAWVTQIARINDDNENVTELIHEPIRCPWRQGTGEERFRVTIRPGLPRRVDLFVVTENEGLVPLFDPESPILSQEITTSGRYRVSVLVTADDVPSASASFVFECQSFRNVWLEQE
jgi:hypothetical protein